MTTLKSVLRKRHSLNEEEKELTEIKNLKELNIPSPFKTRIISGIIGYNKNKIRKFVKLLFLINDKKNIEIIETSEKNFPIPFKLREIIFKEIKNKLNIK